MASHNCSVDINLYLLNKVMCHIWLSSQFVKTLPFIFSAWPCETSLHIFCPARSTSRKFFFLQPGCRSVEIFLCVGESGKTTSFTRIKELLNKARKFSSMIQFFIWRTQDTLESQLSWPPKLWKRKHLKLFFLLTNSD